MGNNDLRTNAKHDVEQELLNLMNNSVFGKTMENVKNRTDSRLTTDTKMAI